MRPPAPFGDPPPAEMAPSVPVPSVSALVASQTVPPEPPPRFVPDPPLACTFPCHGAGSLPSACMAMAPATIRIAPPPRPLSGEQDAELLQPPPDPRCRTDRFAFPYAAPPPPQPPA